MYTYVKKKNIKLKIDRQAENAFDHFSILYLPIDFKLNILYALHKYTYLNFVIT